MNGKKKYLAVAIAVAVTAIVGIGVIAPSNGITATSAKRIIPVKYAGNAQRCANSCPAGAVQCPYLECPYLNHLRQMEKGHGVQLEEAAGRCPYEMQSGRRTMKPATPRTSIVLADEALIHRSADANMKTVRLNGNR